ncbi:uncharacterized protein PRCAT00005916001 [Priceomyces carsonii]|uniref:uncharacterized protein n=1 Tax=Priceomyces carsonii TaxID=28549 RepID=UPI002ED7DBA9|nr:unnamed protein product [Priceomyces carsonii]
MFTYEELLMYKNCFGLSILGFRMEDKDRCETSNVDTLAESRSLDLNIPKCKRYSDMDLQSDRKHRKLVEKENMDTTRKEPSITYSGTGRNLIGRLSKIEGEQQFKLIKSNRIIENKLDEVQHLKNRIMTLKTQRANQEFENFKIESEIIKLKEQLALADGQIEELKHHELTSLQCLQDKYELVSKQLKVEHQERLDKLKEDISFQIERVIQENITNFQSDRRALSKECEDISKEIKAHEQDLNRKLIKLKEDNNKKLIQLNKSLDDSINELKAETQRTIEEKQETLEQFESLKQSLSTSFENSNSELSSKLSNLKANFESKEQELGTLRRKIESTTCLIHDMKNTWQASAREIETYNNKTRELNKFLEDQESERRLLHDKLQNLKGNIRVFCRIKPPPNGEEIAAIDFPEDEINLDSNQELLISKGSPDSSSYSGRTVQSYKFQFDKVFLSTLGNDVVFEELSQLIQCSLDGRNVCVFAYGQTGSGKTFTMSNPNNGMIPLSINKIFDDIEDLKLKNWAYRVEGQIVEIYNETVIDLLGPSSANLKHEIKHDDLNKRTTITNVTSIEIGSKEKARQILEKALRSRSTAATRSNERSSRSHSIFTLRIYGENTRTSEKCEGTLNLIDLAGSERLSNSQAKGERLKETQAINKSLSCLGDVIYALGQQQSHLQVQQHIPYRNSKLTYLLKHSLGGMSKTLMFVNISPLLRDFSETVNSLRFATKVNTTKLALSQGST